MDLKEEFNERFGQDYHDVDCKLNDRIDYDFGCDCKFGTTTKEMADWWLNKIEQVIEDIPDSCTCGMSDGNRTYLKAKWLGKGKK